MEPKLATKTKDGFRFYTWDEKDYPSVTTILNLGLPKPALQHWATKVVAQEAMDNLARLADLDYDAGVSLLRKAPFRSRDKGAERGTTVHQAIDLGIQGEDPWEHLDDETAPYYDAWLSFEHDWQPRVTLNERTVFNLTDGYAGTFDLIMRLGGEEWIADVKTTAAVYPDVALQLVAYARAQQYIGDNDNLVDMPSIDRAGVIHLQPNGKYSFVPVGIGDEIYESFLAVKQVAEWQQIRSKAALLTPLMVGQALTALKELQ